MGWHISLMNYYQKYGCVHQQSFSSESLLRQGGQWLPCAASDELLHTRGGTAGLELPEVAFSGDQAAVPTSPSSCSRAKNNWSVCSLISRSPTCCCSSNVDQEEVSTITDVTSPLPLTWANLWKHFFFLWSHLLSTDLLSRKITREYAQHDLWEINTDVTKVTFFRVVFVTVKWDWMGILSTLIIPRY